VIIFARYQIIADKLIERVTICILSVKYIATTNGITIYDKIRVGNSSLEELE